MKVHVVGTGGREHALRVVLGRTSEIVDNNDAADLIIIGPEVPLVAGLADDLRAKGKLVYGPGRDGARLEGSKAWMKDFVARAGVPTARYGAFEEADEAIRFMSSLQPPYVIKTDGLAQGKGVFITDSLDEAIDDINGKLSGTLFGDAGSRVVIEEGMVGPEISLMWVFDGKNGFAMPIAQDFKRVHDGDVGPNTGGMGAYSDVPVATPALIDQAIERILLPTCAQLQSEGIDYRGTLYAGLMLTADGPKLIEYNVRFGDPETQVIIPRFGGDLAATLASAAAGKLEVDGPIAIVDKAVTVTLASAGYPATFHKGDVITGVEDAEAIPGVMVFKGGTAVDSHKRLVTNGGRVLNVTALAPTLAQARERAYEAVKHINFAGMHYRTDIALAASIRETEESAS